MRKVVGISQKIKRAWLDAVLDRLVQTTDEAELRTFLDKHLKEELPGTESRAKTSGIILRIWSGIPPERIALRDRAVALLPRISGQERIWLHWGMTALAYPFFRDTAEVVGRLLALQDDFTTAQVQAPDADDLGRPGHEQGSGAETHHDAGGLGSSSLHEDEGTLPPGPEDDGQHPRPATLAAGGAAGGQRCRRDRGPAVVASAGVVPVHA